MLSAFIDATTGKQACRFTAYCNPHFPPLPLTSPHAAPACPILELGCGPGSTPLLHAQVARGRRVVSADTNLSWCNPSALSHALHTFKPVAHAWTGWDELFSDEAVEQQQWGVVFVDHWPSVLRPEAMRRFRNSSACVTRAGSLRVFWSV